MKKSVLIIFMMILTFSVFGQNLVQNGDFTLPDDGKDYASIDSIQAWMTDDPVNGKTKRTIRNDGNAVAGLADQGSSMYQEVGTVPSDETSYSINLDGWVYYTWNKNYDQKVNIILAAYSGADPATRVAIDSLELFFDTSVNDWETKGGTITIPAGNEHAGEHLVLEIDMFLHDVGNLSFMYFDNISLEEIVFNKEFQNGDFTLPDDGKDYASIDSIQAWMTDNVVNGKTKRAIRNDGNAVGGLADQGTSIYQIVGSVPSDETTYSISLDGWVYYTWNKNYDQKVNVILAAFSGGDPATRVAIDSLELFFDTSVNDWETKGGEITIPAGNEHAGEHLVLEIEMFLHSSGNLSFMYFDNIVFDEIDFTTEFQNGDFTLPDDGKDYASIDSIQAWMTDDVVNGKTKRAIRDDGNAVGGLADQGTSMYQVVGRVPSDETNYTVSLDGWVYYTWNKNYDQKVNVILAAFSGTDPATRVAIDSLELFFDTSVNDWETKGGEITIPAGNEHAGEHLVLEIEMFLHGSENYSFMYFDNIIFDEIHYTTEFQNGDFTLPDDGKDYASIDSIQAWMTDDVVNGKTKRVIRDDGNAVGGLADQGTSMYQVVGRVPSDAITYSISLDGWVYYTWNKNYEQKVNVILSSFSGSDPSTRVAMDSLELFFDTSVNDWETKSGTITIPAGSEHAGKQLVLEIDMFLHDAGNLSFMYFDNITFGEKEIDFTTEFQNGDFTLPDDGMEYASIDSIQAWMTDDVVNGKTKRGIRDDGNAVGGLADQGTSMYQVVGTVPSEVTTYSISLDGWVYYTWNKNYEQKVNVILAAFSGTDPATRVALDSLELFFDTSVNDWETKGGTITIPAGSEHAGEHLVLEIDMFLHDAGNLSFMYFDNITFGEKEIDFTTEFQNGEFTLPDDGMEYASIDSIQAWMTDDPVNGETKRVIRDDGNAVASLSDKGTSMYQVVGTVPSEETTYEINLDGWCYYTWNKNYNQKVNVILAAFAGADPATRVPIDSLELFFNTNVNAWETKGGEIIIPAGNEHADKHLVLEIDLVLQSAAYLTYFYFDNITFNEKQEYPYFSGVFENGDFELPNDGKDYASIDSIPGWLTDKYETVVSNGGYTGRKVIDGNGVGYHWDGVGGIYQIIGKVPSVETEYHYSYDVTCYYSYWSDYIANTYVIFSSFSGPDPTTRLPLDSLEYQVSCYSDDWNTWITNSGTFTLPAGSSKAGENLVMELEIFDSREYGWNEAWTYLYYDNVEVNSIETGIKDNKPEDDIKIVTSYGNVKILAPERIITVSIYDLMGRRIKTSNVNTFNPEIMVGDMHGIYLIKVDMEDRFVTKKVYIK